MSTALIILNYNNAEDTRCCIESILEHNTAPIKIIVVDNASRIEQLNQLRKDMKELFGKDFVYYDKPSKAASTLPKAVLVETGSNLGYARGNNVGIQLTYADSDIDYVMVLNNDILFVEDIIPRLIEKHKSSLDCAIISPVLYKKGLQEYDYNCARRNMPINALINRNFKHYWWKFTKRNFEDVYPELFLLKGETPTDALIAIEVPSGSCMLIEKKYLQEIGGFDPNTFLYYEENILHKKVLQSGKRNYLSMHDRCIHLGASTMQKLPSSLKVMRESRRSELYYVRQYSGAPRWQRLLHRISASFFMCTFRLQKGLKSINLRSH